MKKVKCCDECGKYNERILAVCKRCGCRLEHLPVIEVPDDEDENLALVRHAEPAPADVPDAPALVKFVCPTCKETLEINPDETFQCPHCSTIITPANQPVESPRPAASVAAESTTIAPTAKRLRFVGVTGQFELNFTVTPQSFGRHNCPLAALQNNSYVSREHFVYVLVDGKTYLIDQSTNGTFLNGARLPKGQPQLLQNGDRLRIYADEFAVVDAN